MTAPTPLPAEYQYLTIIGQINLILTLAAQNEQLTLDQQGALSLAVMDAVNTYDNDLEKIKPLGESSAFTLIFSGENDGKASAYQLLRDLIFSKQKELCPWEMSQLYQGALFQKLLGTTTGLDASQPIGYQIAEGVDVVLHPPKLHGQLVYAEVILSLKGEPYCKLTLNEMEGGINCDYLHSGSANNHEENPLINSLSVSYPQKNKTNTTITYQIRKQPSLQDYLDGRLKIENENDFYQAFGEQIGKQLALKSNFNCTPQNITVDTDSDGKWVFTLTNSSPTLTNLYNYSQDPLPMDRTRGQSTLPACPQSMSSGYPVIDKIFDPDGSDQDVGDSCVSVAFESLNIAHAHDSYAYLLCLYKIADKTSNKNEKEKILISMMQLFKNCSEYYNKHLDDNVRGILFDGSHSPFALSADQLGDRASLGVLPSWRPNFCTPKEFCLSFFPNAYKYSKDTLGTTLKADKAQAEPFQVTITLLWYWLMDKISTGNTTAGDTPQLTRRETLASLFSGKTFEDLCNPKCREEGWKVIESASSLFLRGNRRFKNELVQQAQALLVADVYSQPDIEDKDPNLETTIEKKLREALENTSPEAPTALQEKSELQQALINKVKDMVEMVIKLQHSRPDASGRKSFDDMIRKIEGELQYSPRSSSNDPQ